MQRCRAAILFFYSALGSFAAGFISNTQDVARIASDAGCEAAAQAYYDCILAYFDLQ